MKLIFPWFDNILALCHIIRYSINSIVNWHHVADSKHKKIKYGEKVTTNLEPIPSPLWNCFEKVSKKHWSITSYRHFQSFILKSSADTLSSSHTLSLTSAQKSHFQCKNATFFLGQVTSKYNGGHLSIIFLFWTKHNFTQPNPFIFEEVRAPRGEIGGTLI